MLQVLWIGLPEERASLWGERPEWRVCAFSCTTQTKSLLADPCCSFWNTIQTAKSCRTHVGSTLRLFLCRNVEYPIRRCRNIAKPPTDLQRGCNRGPCLEPIHAVPGRSVVLSWYSSPWQQVGASHQILVQLPLTKDPLAPQRQKTFRICVLFLFLGAVSKLPSPSAPPQPPLHPLPHGQCSVSCGGGVQTRSIQCLRQGRPAAGCLPHQRPVSSRACNTQFCPAAPSAPAQSSGQASILKGKALPEGRPHLPPVIHHVHLVEDII